MVEKIGLVNDAILKGVYPVIRIFCSTLASPKPLINCIESWIEIPTLMPGIL